MARSVPGPLQLGELEMAVLEDIWSEGPSNVKQVHSRLEAERSVVHNTVQSTMDRLFKKGFLTREKVSHAFVYSASLSRCEVLERAVGEVLGHLGGDRPTPALSAFVELTAKEGEDCLRELERLVAERLAVREDESEAEQ